MFKLKYTNNEQWTITTLLKNNNLLLCVVELCLFFFFKSHPVYSMDPDGTLSRNSQDPLLKANLAVPLRHCAACFLCSADWCLQHRQNKRTRLGREHTHTQRRREKIKSFNCVPKVESVYLFLFMSSLTKNGIDHSHHDVQRGRYVGAECNIWRRHLQTKQPSGGTMLQHHVTTKFNLLGIWVGFPQ